MANSFFIRAFASESIFYLMGTYAVIDINDYEKNIMAYRILREIEKKISDYDEYSEITEINRNAGRRRVKVSGETVDVIKKSIIISELTDGYFDITVGALSIRSKRYGEIKEEAARRLINFMDVDINEDGVFLKKEHMALDLGGIGKGYAIEKAFEQLGVPSGYIAIGGDMKIWGGRRRIHVYNPLNNGILIEMTNKKDVCLSTSGNYLKNHIETEDPEILQITIATDDCAFADAIATALFAMSKSKREIFMRENKNIGAILLMRDGRVLINEMIEEYFTEMVINYYQKGNE